MRLSGDSLQRVRIAQKAAPVADRLLLLSLLSIILLAPVLDRGDLRRLFLSALTFVPVLLATIQLSEKKHWLWPSVLLMSLTVAFGVSAIVFKHPVLVVLKWGSLAIFFGFSVFGLFSYLRNARSIQQSHLYTAISVYLLMGMLWFALYAAIDAAYPGSFQHSSSRIVDRESEMLYFSLVTLTTIGYGDILPLGEEARMLAALEGVAGVLYIAITVAILVSAFKRQDSSPSE
jgi:amino acid transporter